MRIFASIGPLEFRWHVGRDYMEHTAQRMIYLFLRWKKHVRGWKLVLEYDAKYPENSSVTYSTDVNGTLEGWCLQGPVRRLY